MLLLVLRQQQQQPHHHHHHHLQLLLGRATCNNTINNFRLLTSTANNNKDAPPNKSAAAAAPPPPPPPAPPAPPTPPNPAIQAAALARARLLDATTVLPPFARLEVFKDSPAPVPKGMGGAISGIPKEMLQRKMYVYKLSANAMQSGSFASKPWRVGFENKQARWANNLMEGYVSGGDAFDVTGLVKTRFDTKEEAIKFLERMGFQYEVVEPPPKVSFEGEKAYDKNFLNYHVQARIARQPPSKTSRTQFGHPERGTPTWINLGNLAVAMGTSARDTSSSKSTKQIDQSYWNAPPTQVSKQPPTSWRSDYFNKSAELARKLGK
jgi:hypothetical protein